MWDLDIVRSITKNVIKVECESYERIGGRAKGRKNTRLLAGYVYIHYSVKLLTVSNLSIFWTIKFYGFVLLVFI